MKGNEAGLMVAEEPEPVALGSRQPVVRERLPADGFGLAT
jgi:hypothetical protein